MATVAAVFSTAATAATTVERVGEGTRIDVKLSEGRALGGTVRQWMKRSIKILTDANDVEIISIRDITSFTVGRGHAVDDATFDAPPPPVLKRDSKVQDGRVPLVIDLETGDPDDIMTLMLAACHPDVQLKAVTVTPGSLEQLQLVTWVLEQLEVEPGTVRLGATEWPTHADKPGCYNNAFYSKLLLPFRPVRGRSRGDSGVIRPARFDRESVLPAAELIKETCAADPRTTLFTGGPLHNLGAALAIGAVIPRWVGQGGFCGAGVVLPGVPTLSKFAGATHVSTWNFGGAIEATEAALASSNIWRRVLAGKNVCHRCEYTADFAADLEARIAQLDAARSGVRGDRRSGHLRALRWFRDAMNGFYRHGKSPKNKKLHDPLAFAMVLDEEVCALREVAVDRRQGKWGSTLAAGTNTFAAVDFDQARFLDSLIGSST